MSQAETDVWLSRVFHAPSSPALAGTYDEWAGSYESDMLAVGYLHPAVASGFVGRHVTELDGRILDRFHNLLDGEQIDRAGLLVQLGDIVFVGAVVLPRRHQQRVLYRIQNDLRLDAFFLAQ